MIVESGKLWYCLRQLFQIVGVADTLTFNFQLKLLLRNNFDAAQVLAQDFGHHDGAVGTLVLLDDGGEDTGGCQTGAVQGVNEVDLAVGAAVTDVAAAGLEVITPKK